jgi:hypothetical protein
MAQSCEDVTDRRHQGSNKLPNRARLCKAIPKTRRYHGSYGALPFSSKCLLRSGGAPLAVFRWRNAVPPGAEIARGAVPDDATIALAAAFEAGLTTLRAPLQEERQRPDRLQAELTDTKAVVR